MDVRQEGGEMLAPSWSATDTQSSGSRWINLFTSSIPTMFSLFPLYTGSLEWPCVMICRRDCQGEGERERELGELTFVMVFLSIISS